MDLIQTLISLLQKWFIKFTTISGGLQLAAIIGCGTLALLTHKRWQAFITKLASGFSSNAFIRFLLHGTDRIAFPMSMLIYILVCSFILDQFGLNIAILEKLTPLILALAAVRLAVYILRRGFSPSPALRAWEGVISLGIWGFVALHLVGWLPDILDTLDSLAVDFGDGKFSLLSLIKLITAIIVFIVSANWVSRLIEQKARRSQYISPSMRVGLTKISKFLLYTVAFLFALKSVGIDLTTFAVFSGAVGVGIGFGLQKIFSNFISGFILLFDRSIRPGDVISIGDRVGWVQALHARYVVVRDRDGVETLIPNENLITSEVTNWSYTDRAIRIRMPIQISYNDDPEQVLDIILECGKAHERVLKDPEPVSRLIGFGDNGIDLELRVWMLDPELGIGSVRSDVYLAIWKQFKEKNITIPFPQRDVRLYNTPEP
jgi:small-conductance mechanosensitive channel